MRYRDVMSGKEPSSGHISTARRKSSAAGLPEKAEREDSPPSASGIFFAIVFAGGLFVGWLLRGAMPATEPKIYPPLDSTQQIDVSQKSPVVAQSTLKSDTLPNESQTTTVSAKGAPRTAVEVLERLLTEIEQTDPKRLGSLPIQGRLQQLRDFGEEGSQAIAEYIHTGNDLEIASSSTFSNTRLVTFTSIRIALLEALYEQRDPAAMAANAGVLKSSIVPLEVLLSARNLEKARPGVFRAEIVKATLDLMAIAYDPKDPKSPDRVNWRNSLASEVAAHFQVKELLSPLEARLLAQPYMTQSYIGILSTFPSSDQASALQRIMTQEKVRKALATDVYALSPLDYTNPQIRQLTLTIFVTEMSPAQKDQFVQSMGQIITVNSGSNLFRPEEGAPSRNASSRKKFEGLLQLIDDLITRGDSPALLQKLTTARKLVQQNWQNSPAEAAR